LNLKNKAILLTLKFHYAPSTVCIDEMEVVWESAKTRINLNLGARGNIPALCDAHDAIGNACCSTYGNQVGSEDYMRSVHNFFRNDAYFTKDDYMQELGLPLKAIPKCR
jgi:hypothetical protein